MTILRLDLETYSPVDLFKTGVYPYAEHPDFEILLFGYAFDSDPVTVVDLARGEELPRDVRVALTDHTTLKVAYNAQFERICLSRYLHTSDYLPPETWRCTQVHGLYLGLPGNLLQLSQVVLADKDREKMETGKDLISYFCKPCKPTKTNGGRTRNLPHHAPEKWQQFVEYNRRDVEAERAVSLILGRRPVPSAVWDEYHLDQRINDRGVRVDRELVARAIECDALNKAELKREAIELTGLVNPGSVQQMSAWLVDEHTVFVESLDKETVKDLLKTSDDAVLTRALELRQELSKSSVKKYAAMDSAVCKDGRIRGLLQFYGANRTGRWCLTGDHEVLTKEGWARFDSWDGGYIACWTPQTEFVSFQKAGCVSFDYEGDLYAIESQRCSQLSTPDHKMIHWARNGGWEIETVENLSSKRFTLPFTGRRITNSSLEHNRLRILVMAQADGHFTEDGSLRFHFSKQRKIERCKSLLRREELVYTEAPSGKTTTFSIKPRNLPLWLKMFRQKTFGPWLFDESPDVFFEELELWDGYRCGPNSIQYSTINKQNADIIQAFAHLSGRAATMIVKNREKDEWSTAYILNIWLNPGNRNEVRDHPTKQSFKGAVYCAETTTGFFLVRRNGKVWVTGNSGRLVQVQNLPQNHLPDLADARAMLKAGDYETIEMLHGSVQNVLSQLIRTAFIPADGHQFLVSDFSAIEARVIAWLAGEEWRMEVFRTHGKIYEASASAMFHVPVEQITKANPLRQKGKIAELALGYQGAAGALITMGALKMGLTEADLPGLVAAWRKANPKIVQLWGDVENAAMAAVHEGMEEKVGPLTFYCDGKRWLLCRLPSGRELAYAQPRIQPDGRFGRMSLTYEGMNQETKRWQRIPTYGGKLVENCLAGDTEVLTQDGWKAIVDIEATDLVHDGEAWVSHEGLARQGYRDTIEVNGVRMTPDHKILTESGWVCASSCEGYIRAKIWAFDGPALLRDERVEVALAGAVRLRNGQDDAGDGVPQGESEILRMPAGQSNIGKAHHARNVTPPSLCSMAIDGRSLHTTDAPGLAQLRGPWHNGVRILATFVRGLLERYGSWLSGRAIAGSDRQRQGLLPGELSLDRCEDTRPEQKNQRVYQHPGRANNSVRSVGAVWDRGNDAVLPTDCWVARAPFTVSAGRTEPVFDLINAGPRHRFLVRGAQGPFLVHNCVQAIARDCLAETLRRCKDLRIAMHIHDEVVIEVRDDLTESTESWVAEAMADPIPWAPGLPLRGDGFVTEFYRKED